ncbi:hypothetical protein [Salmonella enterica]|nr:hypothetical protein [Salmonella enterica]
MSCSLVVPGCSALYGHLPDRGTGGGLCAGPERRQNSRVAGFKKV